jgi:Fic family protein
MDEPRYKITNRLLAFLEEIAAISSRISESRLQLPVRLRLERETARRNAHSSTSIEGNRLSLEQVADLSEERAVRADAKQKLEVVNYLKALRWVFGQSRRDMNENKLLRLNLLLTRGLLDKHKAGHYKKKQNYVLDGRGRVVYTPPSPVVTPELTQKLLRWVSQSGQVHPVIVSAVFHHRLVSIHPFPDGNGRVARAGAQWILYRRGFDPGHFYAIDDFYSNDRDRYYEKIQQARELDGDLTCWIEYVAEGLLVACKDVFERIRDLSRSPRKKIRLTPKQEALLAVLRAREGIGSAEIGRQLKIGRARIHQLMAPLIRAGVLKREGRARATRYYL